ncbi:MAG: tail fiber domain-containing protein [Aureispira sp.]
MKKLSLMIGLMCSVAVSQGQSSTYTGANAGNTGSANSFYGYYSGSANTVSSNSGFGAYSVRYNTTGARITAMGYASLYKNTTGSDNTALGHRSLMYNTIGFNNTAVGSYALEDNTIGEDNVAFGRSTLEKNIFGRDNVAMGSYALYSNYDGQKNIAIGKDALYTGSSSSQNIGIGWHSMKINTGSLNVGIGSEALINTFDGNFNTGIGNQVMYQNETGSHNTAIGYQSNYNNKWGNYNTAIGELSLQYNEYGSYNSGIGYGTSINGGVGVVIDEGTALGAYARATASYQVRIGSSYINSIGGYQSWSNVSDGRFKNDVQEDVMGLKFINALRPVSYELDLAAIDEFLGVERGEQAKKTTRKTHQTGFIAQEVEATAQKLGFEQFSGVDAPKHDNDHYGLRYAEFVVPLVKSVQELSAQNEAQTATIDELKALVQQQQAQINQLLGNTTTNSNSTNTNSTLTSTAAQLYQNVPNPHKGQTQIKVFVPQTSGKAFLQVTDLSGKQLIFKDIATNGETVITLHTQALTAGMYLYSLVVDQEVVATKKMVIVQ